ncbi:lipopolysaccharide biosynthesis protein [uncultured Dubosiella sp.]|uniref:lipopolysaccharide biosynthesis protein n=1 Tax=uncultured Dubosiella sp. TaxID=1937011 RepID=UPI002612ABEE|nr:lipopolysaccharide biosynthesis protein [uncultured Dubosiella sp.]
MNDLKNRAMNGLVWKLSEKVGMQAIQFILQIILARILTPEDYGVIGLLSIFIVISDVFIYQGLTSALIQKEKTDALDYSTVFYSNIIISIFIYIALFFLSPLIGTFYNDNNLIIYMRVLSLNVIFGAFGAVHNTILAKQLDFKKSFFRGMVNIGTQGVVGIALALNGFGAWALVYSKLFGTFMGSLALVFTVRWRPQVIYSFSRIQSMLKFGSKMLGTNLLNTTFNNVHSLIIGKYYTSSALGFYQRGQQIPQTIMTSIDGSLSEVLYPALSLVQGNLSQLKNALRRSLKLSVYFTLPLMFGLMAVTKPLVIILLTEKWLPCVPYMQLSCLICSFWPLAMRYHALNALGKSNVTFRVSIITKMITLFLIFLLLPYGIEAIMCGTIFSSIISLLMTNYYSSKYLNYSSKEFFKDITPSVFITILMTICVKFIEYLINNIYICLIVQIIIGILVYITLSVILKNESFIYSIKTLKELRGKIK